MGDELGNRDDVGAKAEALRERLSRLSEASLAITEDLDLDTVLRRVVDGARSVTGARIGSITVLDDEGQLEQFITSGLSPEEHQMFMDLPGGLEFFAYLSSLSEPLRLADFSEHTTSAGLPPIGPPLGPVASFLGAPIRHRGRSLGNFYLSQKQGSAEFSAEDEDTLVMFASHAAMAISNAHRYRAEQRARADLETLIDTSPVGVVVLDAEAGVPMSLNREARRIVEGLRDPDQPAEQLLDILAFRRADGQEISLQESPLAQALSTGETIRAEEIVIRVPDGRSVTTLVNATPIRSEEGHVESTVVTLQDLTALGDLNRLRAEFLAMVSHELRAPLTSIKGAAATLIGSGSSLDPAVALQFHRIIDEQTDRMQSLVTDLLDVAQIEAGTLPVSPEPTDPTVLVDRATSTLSGAGTRHNIRIDIPPDLPTVIADPRRITQVLVNLLSNAARHSPQTSTIAVSLSQQDVHIEFCVADSGVGIDPDRLPYLFGNLSPTTSTRPPTGGLGLAICKGIVEAHGGRIWAESDGVGTGTKFTFTLPAATASTYKTPPIAARLPIRPDRGRRHQVRVLALDDDPPTLRYLRDTLTDAGYTPVVTGEPDQLSLLMQEARPHIALLDLILPGTDAIELLDTIPELAEVPVIFLSAYGNDQTIARALEAGADDYMVKPFTPTELTARIQAALRRRTTSQRTQPTQPYELADLTIDYDQRRVTVAGRAVQLTAIEHDLLHELSANAPQLVTHTHLLQRIWGPGHTTGTAKLRTAIKNLRRKLGDDANNPTYIFNEPRIGYRMPHAKPKKAD